MRNLEHRIKILAISKGADLVGIAPVDRLKDAPEGHRPTDILPNAKTVIVCAKKLPNGLVMKGPATSYSKTKAIINSQLDLIAYEVATYVETCGGTAIPIPSNEPYYSWDPDRQHGLGDLSHKHAAEAAGLGRIGKNSLLITRESGNRVQLVSVVTNLELDPDSIIEEELCLPNCTACLRSCPVKAIKKGHVDQKKCRSHMFLELPKGQIIHSCWECRKACPIGVTHSRPK